MTPGTEIVSDGTGGMDGAGMASGIGEVTGAPLTASETTAPDGIDPCLTPDPFPAAISQPSTALSAVQDTFATQQNEALSILNGLLAAAQPLSTTLDPTLSANPFPDFAQPSMPWGECCRPYPPADIRRRDVVVPARRPVARFRLGNVRHLP